MLPCTIQKCHRSIYFCQQFQVTAFKWFPQYLSAWDFILDFWHKCICICNIVKFYDKVAPSCFCWMGCYLNELTQDNDAWSQRANKIREVQIIYKWKRIKRIWKMLISTHFTHLRQTSGKWNKIAVKHYSHVFVYAA